MVLWSRISVFVFEHKSNYYSPGFGLGGHPTLRYRLDVTPLLHSWIFPTASACMVWESQQLQDVEVDGGRLSVMLREIALRPYGMRKASHKPYVVMYLRFR